MIHRKINFCLKKMGDRGHKGDDRQRAWGSCDHPEVRPSPEPHPKKIEDRDPLEEKRIKDSQCIKKDKKDPFPNPEKEPDPHKEQNCARMGKEKGLSVAKKKLHIAGILLGVFEIPFRIKKVIEKIGLSQSNEKKGDPTPKPRYLLGEKGFAQKEEKGSPKKKSIPIAPALKEGAQKEIQNSAKHPLTLIIMITALG
jgi:hypothetical protein